VIGVKEEEEEAKVRGRTRRGVNSRWA
jgi:hypothetical protein